jgi:ABC-type transport system involved in Fe-S cluster assembly fused permease/ATPase subunit
MRLPAGLDVTLVYIVLRCNYDLSKFPFITNCQVVLYYVVQVWLFENGPM